MRTASHSRRGALPPLRVASRPLAPLGRAPFGRGCADGRLWRSALGGFSLNAVGWRRAAPCDVSVVGGGQS